MPVMTPKPLMSSPKGSCRDQILALGPWMISVLCALIEPHWFSLVLTKLGPANECDFFMNGKEWILEFDFVRSRYLS